METSRIQVADLINADPKEIVFTSGATESNNISVKGVARLVLFLRTKLCSRHCIIISLFVSQILQGQKESRDNNPN